MVSRSGSKDEILATMILSKLRGQCNKGPIRPKLRMLKLMWVTAFMLFILSFSGSVWADYDVTALQEKALANSVELKILRQAIKTAEAKKWTSFAPRVGIGNNFVGDGDMRFNVTFDLVETLGGGKLRQINLDAARLRLQKYELENKIKLEVLELVLALQRMERRLASDDEKLAILKRRLALIQVEYKRGKGELVGLTKYWEIEMKLQDDKAINQDEITLRKAKLEQLIGEKV